MLEWILFFGGGYAAGYVMGRWLWITLATLALLFAIMFLTADFSGLVSMAGSGSDYITFEMFAAMLGLLNGLENESHDKLKDRVEQLENEAKEANQVS